MFILIVYNWCRRIFKIVKLDVLSVGEKNGSLYSHNNPASFTERTHKSPISYQIPVM